MEITNFVDMDFLMSFTGTLVTVELLVFCTKGFPLIKRIPTRFYSFLIALAHISIVKCISNTMVFTVDGFYLMIINSVFISVILCGGYDVVVGNIKIPSNISNKEIDDNEIILENKNIDEKERD